MFNQLASGAEKIEDHLPSIRAAFPDEIINDEKKSLATESDVQSKGSETENSESSQVYIKVH